MKSRISSPIEPNLSKAVDRGYSSSSKRNIGQVSARLSGKRRRNRRHWGTTMDFNLPEELQMLKDTVRKFVDHELIPIEMHSQENNELKLEIRERLEKKTKGMGLWMFDVPEEYGGGGLGSLAQVLVWEQMCRTIALPSRGRGIFGPEIRPILYALNDDQKKRFLDPILRGEKELCFMQTEPDAGSDPGSMKTRAVRQGDYYIVNGTKRFITGADKADFGQLMAVTDPAKGSH